MSRSKRVCAEPGCPVISDSVRCTAHTRERDRERGTRQQRGYDNQHDRMRADYQRQMDAGLSFVCWRCAEQGKPHRVDPANWHLGHDDADRTRYRGPECPAGNLAVAARRPGPGVA